MMIAPRIELLVPKKLIGQKLEMSISNNRTQELWQHFMKRRSVIENTIGTDLYSVQKYNDDYFMDFNPNREFKKWAAVEVADFDHIPEGMEMLELNGGLYAVFLYKGAAKEGAKFFQYIFSTWLPQSEYKVDNSRPHFEVLGEKYKNNDPASEEEIWIPVRRNAECVMPNA